MKQTFKKVFLLNLLLFSGLNAQSLTLTQAIEMALDYHPDVKVFKLKQAQSKESVSISRSEYLPQLSFNAEYDPIKTYVLPQNGTFHTKDEQGWHAGVVLKQKIWDFEKTTSAIDASKLQNSIDALNLKNAKASLALKVKTQYALMLVQQEAIEVRKKDLQTKKELYDQAQALVKLGMKTEADASRFLSSYYIAKNNLSISHANYEKARQTLELYIGQKLENNVVLETSVLYKELNITPLFSEVEHENPQLLATLESVKKSDALYTSIHAAHFGSIDAVASYDHQDTLNEYDAKVLGISATIPLYVGGRISAQAQQAALRTQEQKEHYNAQKISLQTEFESLLIDLARYTQTIAAKKAQLEASQATKKVLDARYKEGVSTYIEVLDATALYLDAELGLLEAYYSKSTIINTLTYLKGEF